jgi:hypothetical protein
MTSLKGKIGQIYLIGGKAERRNIEVVRAIIATIRKLAPERRILPTEDLITYVQDGAVASGARCDPGMGRSPSINSYHRMVLAPRDPPGRVSKAAGSSTT